MRPLSGLGIGLSLVFGCLFLALIAEVYYLLWWKKRVVNRDVGDGYSGSARELVDLFCRKKPSSLSSAALNPREIHASARITDESVEASGMKPGGGENGLEAELAMGSNISNLPRLLFTITEETKEDLESEDAKTRSDRSRKSSTEKISASDVQTAILTPYMTPMSSPPFFTPPLTPVDEYRRQGFNPLLESAKAVSLPCWIRASPPPKFKFLRDAEEKLYRKALMEESRKLRNCSLIHQVGSAASPTSPPDEVLPPPPSSSETSGEEEDGSSSFITIRIVNNKHREEG